MKKIKSGGNLYEIAEVWFNNRLDLQTAVFLASDPSVEFVHPGKSKTFSPSDEQIVFVEMFFEKIVLAALDRTPFDPKPLSGHSRIETKREFSWQMVVPFFVEEAVESWVQFNYSEYHDDGGFSPKSVFVKSKTRNASSNGYYPQYDIDEIARSITASVEQVRKFQ